MRKGFVLFPLLAWGLEVSKGFFFFLFPHLPWVLEVRKGLVLFPPLPWDVEVSKGLVLFPHLLCAVEVCKGLALCFPFYHGVLLLPWIVKVTHNPVFGGHVC